MTPIRFLHGGSKNLAVVEPEAQPARRVHERVRPAEEPIPRVEIAADGSCRRYIVPAARSRAACLSIGRRITI
jgi:hypothetical protein